MVGTSSIELFLESIKSAGVISRELISLVRSGAASEKIGEMNAKILEAQQFALAAQTDQFTLSKKIGDIEKELVDMKDFRREKENYELQNIGNTAFIYAYKPSVESSQVRHWLCSTCCEQDRKSILQYAGKTVQNIRVSYWKCHSCGSDIRVSSNHHP